MGIQVDQAVCPKCGHQGLFISTKDWQPVNIHCPIEKCGWQVNLKPFWPPEKMHVFFRKRSKQKAKSGP